jgi:hypothetical protein
VPIPEHGAAPFTRRQAAIPRLAELDLHLQEHESSPSG